VKHKRQHFVPQSYLKAWCDPDTPTGQEPYVWLYEKKGDGVRKKSPAKTFVETDFYTIKVNDGGRDLRLEHGLSQLEARFAALRQNRLSRGLPITPRDHLHLCAFVATMHARTKSRNEFLREQWQGALDMMKRLDAAMQKASPEQSEQMARALVPLDGENRTGMTMADVESVADHPVQQLLSGEAHVVTLGLMHIPFTIIEAADSPGFIASDAPCVWFDSELYNESPAFGAGGLISPTLEICMPLSPRQLILFGYQHIAGNQYLPPAVGDRLVDLVNRRIWDYADEYVVVNQQVDKQPWRMAGQEELPEE
jgi:hypothetical protein